MLEVAADSVLCSDVAATAWGTTRILDPDTAEVAVHDQQLPQWSGHVPDVLMEVRRPVSHPQMRGYAGLASAPTEAHGNRSVWFESLNELAHFRDIFLTRPVTQLASQPMRLTWNLPGGIRTHIPDAVFRERDGRTTLVDVTTGGKILEPQAMAVFAITAATAAAAGWDYELRTELPRQRVRNLSFLRACRLGHAPSLIAAEALAKLSWPAQARAVSLALDPSGNGGVAALWRQVAAGLLFVDLDAPLRRDSLVHREPSQSRRRPSWLVEL